jgi:hypothetical protein
MLRHAKTSVMGASRAGQFRVEKPPLGKRRALPEREVKTDIAMFLSLPIDPDLWNQANWRATVFMQISANDPPILGLGFTNEAAARQIFQGWHERYGSRDEFEELRVSIIEGEIPGQGLGYTVHIGADAEANFRRYKQLGLMRDGDFVAVISKFNRMNAPNSPNLAQFKKAYRESKTYFLAPVLVDGEGQQIRILKPILEANILKGRIHFRDVSEIGEHDPDTVILRKSKD